MMHRIALLLFVVLGSGERTQSVQIGHAHDRRGRAQMAGFAEIANDGEAIAIRVLPHRSGADSGAVCAEKRAVPQRPSSHLDTPARFVDVAKQLKIDARQQDPHKVHHRLA